MKKEKIEKIDINEIKGEYQNVDLDGKIISAGDDTIKSIKIIAEKVNEIIEVLKERLVGK